MKKDDFFIDSLFHQANPLRLKNKDGSSKMFVSRNTLYYNVMQQIRELSAPTYVDVLYILSELYCVRLREAQSIFRLHFRPLGIEQYTVIEVCSRKSKGFFRSFFRALHSYCNTHFDVYAFDNAFDTFIADNEYIELMKKQDEATT